MNLDLWIKQKKDKHKSYKCVADMRPGKHSNQFCLIEEKRAQTVKSCRVIIVQIERSK